MIKEYSRKIYGKTLVELGKQDRRIVAIEADLVKASGSEPFQEVFPERLFNVGVAEQNLIGVAAGLAAMGKIPFASAFASFVSQRGCDQAMNSVAYNNFNVKITGTYAGLSQEKNGGTHISIADVSIFRAMPNMVVIVPADTNELAASMRAAAEHIGPVYIRIARGPLPQIFDENMKFSIGKSTVISEGTDITLITSGITTWEGINACSALEAKGISVNHIHMPTVKPLDQDAIIKAAKKTGAIITVENHTIIGGLGSAVAEAVCENYPVPVIRLGMKDCFGETATLDYLMDKFGISAKHIANTVETFLTKNKK